MAFIGSSWTKVTMLKYSYLEFFYKNYMITAAIQTVIKKCTLAKSQTVTVIMLWPFFIFLKKQNISFTTIQPKYRENPLTSCVGKWHILKPYILSIFCVYIQYTDIYYIYTVYINHLTNGLKELTKTKLITCFFMVELCIIKILFGLFHLIIQCSSILCLSICVHL